MPKEKKAKQVYYNPTHGVTEADSKEEATKVWMAKSKKSEAKSKDVKTEDLDTKKAKKTTK